MGNKIVTPRVDGLASIICSKLKSLVVCMCLYVFVCMPLHCSVQLGTVFCVYLVLLAKKISHKRMHNSLFCQLVWDTFPIFKEVWHFAGFLLVWSQAVSSVFPLPCPLIFQGNLLSSLRASV